MEQAPKPAEATKPKSRKGLYAVIGAVVIIIVVVLGLWLAGVFNTGTSTPGTPVTVYGNGTYASCSNYTNCGFDPSTLTVAHGTKVTWTSNSTTPHTVTECTSGSGCPNTDATALSPAFNSGSGGFSSGQSYSYTFSTAGTYYYYCLIHPSTMHGKIIVT